MTTYYIDPAGNDTTGNGSSGNPWATISKAVSSSAANDTIIVNDGSYTWSSQSIADRIVQGANARGATFDAGAAATIRWTLSGTVTLKNLIFTNMSDFTTQSSPIYYTGNNTALTITHCVFHNITINGNSLGRSGLIGNYSGSGGFPTFINNSVIVNSCEFYDIKSRTSPATSDTAILCCCTNYFVANPITWQYNAVYIDETGTSKIDHIINVVDDATKEITDRNNIIMNNSGETMSYRWRTTPTWVVSSNNCRYLISDAPTDTNGITSNPLFVDPVNGNFNLRPTSPCIDAGVII